MELLEQGINQMGNRLTSSFQSGSTGDNKNTCQRRFPASTDEFDYHILPNSSLIKFSFKELKAATRDFNPDTLVCNGRIGDVFKGWLDLYEKQQPIAIKRLYLLNVQDQEKMLTQIRFLGMLSHPNLVEFLGYCYEDSRLFLVYEYAKRGSLESHLFGRGSRVQPLSWELRIKIAIGAARGITFLGKSDDLVILKHIKPSNILLDEEHNAKFDFGLEKLSPLPFTNRYLSTLVWRSISHTAPEYIVNGHLTLKNDVYSFGVVLVELLTGCRASDLTHSDATFDHWEWVKPYLLGKRSLISIMDSRLGNYPKRAAIETAKIASNCLAVYPNDRPSMEEVLERLEQIQAIDYT